MVLTEASVLERVRASAAVTPAAGGRKVSFRAMGTLCQITFMDEAGVNARGFIEAALHWVSAFEERYSRFLPDSLVSRINQTAGREWVAVDEETDRLFSMCQELHFYTRGAFDPTALPLILLWNWRANPPVLPSDAAIRAALDLVGWRKIQRRPGAIHLPREGMGIDLGGIGKEYAVDRVTQLAHEHGLRNVLVDFGQDIRATGKPLGGSVWHVGLQDPKEPDKCWTGVAVQDMAVATSGGYFRRFELNGRSYGHILDPRSGYPVAHDCQAVSVIAPTCTFAGALCTSAFILGEQEGFKLLENYYGAEGCILTSVSRHQTRRFNEYLTH